jgi:hypothetical protein
MAENGKASNGGARSNLAYGILAFSTAAIIVLAIYVIRKDPDNAMTIFNIVLPVFASWVGTILAFYFGRENFESANKQVRELVQRLTPEERAKALVNSIMRSLDDMVHFEIPAGKAAQDIKLSELSSKFGGNVSRLPITDAEKKPKYMIHDSSIDKYVASGGKLEDSLEKFLDNRKNAGIEFGIDKGFVVVSEQTTLTDAKRKMEGKKPLCQDIFITKKGNSDEPLVGWVSNVRLAKFLEA